MRRVLEVERRVEGGCTALLDKEQVLMREGMEGGEGGEGGRGGGGGGGGEGGR